jgi:Zn-dependent protease
MMQTFPAKSLAVLDTVYIRLSMPRLLVLNPALLYPALLYPALSIPHPFKQGRCYRAASLEVSRNNMKAQIKLGTVFGVELGLHSSWFVIALLIMFSLVARFHAVNRDWSETVVWSAAVLTSVLFFAGLFAHELSHALVAKARGLPIHRITLYLLGGMAQMDEDARDPSTEFLMAIAGPVASGAIGLMLLALARALGWIPWTSAQTPAIAILVWLGYINLVLGAFNMIPGFPMDGGRCAPLSGGSRATQSVLRRLRQRLAS